MRTLGLDVGDRRIGVALSDALGLTAQPLALLERQGLRRDVEAVCELSRKSEAGAIVVGLPLTLRGEEGPQAEKVRAFAEALRSRSALPVHLIDERLTTVQGERTLREGKVSRRLRKQKIDQVAAQLILQQYLETQRPAPEDEG